MILEEHIYRWNCPNCWYYNTAYYKETPKELLCALCDFAVKNKMKIDCTNCSGCDYHCRKEEEMNNGHFGFRNSDFEFPDDLEKANFLAWYRDATVEEIAVARRNNSAKLDALTRKYAKEIDLIEIFLPRNGRLAHETHERNENADRPEKHKI